MNKLYKYSQYNIEIENKPTGDTYVFNTYTSHGRWIPKADLDDIKDNQSIDLGDVPIYLAKEQFIIPNNIDEYERLTESNNNRLSNPSMLDLTIAVTRSCNYNCTYCFEKNELGAGNISSKTIDGIIKFIEKKLMEHDFKSIRVVYFGGEPLLNISAIKEIAQKLRNITDIPIIGHITTNGRYLTPEIVNELKDYNIQSAQITLDGLPEEYAQLKGCKESDFYSVIDNIMSVQNTIRIEIRLNVGSNNVESVKKLISFLVNEGLKCTIYIDNIKYYEHNEKEFKEDYADYVQSYKEIINYVYQNHYEDYFYKIKVRRACAACQANMPYYFAIDIDGNIYKCPDFIFKKNFVVGNVQKGVTVQALDDIFIKNPLYTKCEKCAYKPLCNGLCTTDRIIFNKGINCEALKEWYKYRLQLQLKYNGTA